VSSWGEEFAETNKETEPCRGQKLRVGGYEWGDEERGRRRGQAAVKALSLMEPKS